MKNSYQSIIKGIAVFAFAILPLIFFGQETEEKEPKQKSSTFAPYWFVHGDLGVTDYHGTVARYDFAPDFEKINIGGTFSFGRQFFPFFGLEGEFFRGFLTGQKKDYNQYFDADLFETNLIGSINLINLIAGYKEGRTITVDAKFGYGAMQYWARLYDLQTDARLRELGREGNTGIDEGKGLWDRRIVATIPVGLGFNFAVNESWDIDLDWRYKFVDTRLLDGNSLQPGTVQKDMYQYLGLGATWKFGHSSGLKNMAKNFDQVTFTTTPDPLVEKGDSIEVTITGNIPPKYMGKKTAILFQPVLVYEGGETPLKAITLKGEDVVGEGILINSKTGGTFTYTDKIPYTPEMNNSELVVEPIAYTVKEKIHYNRDEIKIKEKFVDLGQRKLADGVIYTSERICPGRADMIAGYHGYEKEVIISEKGKIFFKVNLYNVNWSYPLNKKGCTLGALEELWAFVEKGWEIKNVEIDGWASPEGEETFNEDLSLNRAKSSYTYMINKFKRISWKKDATVDYKNPEEQVSFAINHHGPDWTGFMNGVEKSEIKDKNVILNVIRSAGSQEKKEQEIRNMILIYPEIEEDILKPLRRSCLTVNCYEPKRTDIDIAELATTYPDSLKVEELLFAATMTDNSKTKVVIYESIIELYPENWQAFNNAGILKIDMGQYDEALALLSKAQELAPNNGKIYNNLGVLYLYKGDFVKAEEMFRKAQSLGENTNYNMGLIEINKGDYAKAQTLFGSTNCDYNVGLAQLVAGDYSSAEKTLKCADDKMGETYYLLAIIGANTDNSSMMYEYLTKAIQTNDDFKSQAANDREFVLFVNEPDFKALVD